jgi:hypothetical protein
LDLQPHLLPVLLIIAVVVVGVLLQVERAALPHMEEARAALLPMLEQQVE